MLSTIDSSVHVDATILVRIREAAELSVSIKGTEMIEPVRPQMCNGHGESDV